MKMQVRIKNDDRGLLFKNGNYVKCLKPGRYILNPFSNYKVTTSDINDRFEVDGKNINLFLKDQDLIKELTVIDVQDHELVLHYADDKFVEVLLSGKYAFWNIITKHDFVTVDLRNPEIQAGIQQSLYYHPKLAGCLSYWEVASYEKGILYYNNVVQKTLEPGKYFFWKSPVQVGVRNVDLRQQQLDMTGQEIMTEDKITLRLNFVCQYKIVDPLQVLEIKSFEEQLYIVLQLILREYVGSLRLDDLLSKKQEIGTYVLGKLKERSTGFGVEFISAGVKDIILPGEIKGILNMVLVAEKQAQANVITRREETASTRSLLNTAKLMEENQTLYRLKELEFLEKICDRIGNISLTGGGSLLEQLNNLFAAKAVPK